eukprot:4903465-Alexandrium_andersonii.AAC.1
MLSRLLCLALPLARPRLPHILLTGCVATFCRDRALLLFIHVLEPDSALHDRPLPELGPREACLLYTSDAADDM